MGGRRGAILPCGSWSKVMSEFLRGGVLSRGLQYEVVRVLWGLRMRRGVESDRMA